MAARKAGRAGQPAGAVLPEGELTWRVPPLAIPQVEGVEPGALDENDAARLFVARVLERVPSSG